MDLGKKYRERGSERNNNGLKRIIYNSDKRRHAKLGTYMLRTETLREEKRVDTKNQIISRKLRSILR